MNRIRLETASAILGVPYSTLKMWRRPGNNLEHIGQRQGREVLVDMGEAGALALIAGLQAGNRPFEASVASALSLAPFVAQIDRNELGAGGLEVFAVMADRPDGTKFRIIAEGVEELKAAVATAVASGYEDVRTLNLSRLLARLFIGWGLATGDPSEIRRTYLDSVLDLPPERQAAAAALFIEVKRALNIRPPVSQRAAFDRHEIIEKRLPPAPEPTPTVMHAATAQTAQPRVRV